MSPPYSGCDGIATAATTPVAAAEPANVQVQIAEMSAAPKKLGPEDLAKLKELKGLIDNDVLTQDEFDAQKMAMLT